MPKGTRNTSYVTKSKLLGGNSTYRVTDSSGKRKWASDNDDVRIQIGDEGLKQLKDSPDGSTVTSSGYLHLSSAAKKKQEEARKAKDAADQAAKQRAAAKAKRKAQAEKAKATVDKAGKDAIELVRRKKSTYRDDYKE